MLDAIGARDEDALYASLSRSFQLDRPLDLPPARSELELQRALADMSARNRPACNSGYTSFLGCGAYEHFIPATVDALAADGRFLTAYTPYQAEASQGALQAFFEFQTQIARLTGLDVANASLYESATAVVEAISMALNVTGKRRVLIASTLHPHYREVVRTQLSDLPAHVIDLPCDVAAGVITQPALREALDDDTACVVVQSPNVFGLLEDSTGLFAAAHKHEKTLAIAVFNPIAAALIKTPGDCGADVAVGEGQPLGIALQYGGPWLGLFATRANLMRKMPGRLVGQTTDTHGRRAFCLTLQTREQHIRGAKATSNVCTNQGLLALRATMYMSTMGPQGLRDVAEQCYHKAHYTAQRIAALDGFDLAFGETPFFHEFVVNCPASARTIIDGCKAHGVLPGIDCAAMNIGNERQLLITVTETRTRAQIDALVDLLGRAVYSQRQFADEQAVTT